MVNPVILIPGLAGSRLKTHNKNQSEEGVTGGKLWVGQDMAPPPPGQTIQKVDEQTDVEYPPSNIVGLNAPVYPVKTDQPPENPVVTNWKKNLKLKDSNGITPEVETDQNPPLTEDDPDIQFNRFVDGIQGIKNLAVSQKELNDIKALIAISFGENRKKLEELYAGLQKVNYFSELVTALLDTDEYRGEAAALPANLVALPYDWRISPAGLEQRYQYFSKLKSTIEELYKAKPLILKPATPVVIIAHSMGNRVTQYFLEWIKNDPSAGQAWIDKHIERYVAVSPPWIGAPLAIRLLSTDDGFNLGGASLSGIKKALQSFSSIPSLLPVTKAQYEYFNTTDFSFIRNEGVAESQTIASGDFRAETTEKILQLGGAESTTLKYIKDYYEQDPNFSDGEFGSKAVTSPPVKNVDVIYSTGFESPVGAYYYQEKRELKVASYLGTPEEPVEDGNFIVINGVRLEKADRTQQLISDDGLTNSGDGVVAYGSLAYFRTWQPNPDVPGQTITPHPFAKPQGTEAPGLVEKGIDLSHNAILRHPDVIARIFSLLGVSKVTPTLVKA
ncbi:lipase/acyltransferase domain-containing protein [Nostoc sp. PCC 9305]|uniref:lipase/acyltransferase domain-containing protein n=1 Tax=Nostoc sp. PCC 9305 TaxID=296636 RepID=UPI0039C65124